MEWGEEEQDRRGAVQHLMKSKFSLILVESKPHTFQLNLQSKQTSLGSLILITQWILAVPALLYQFARYFQPVQRSSCSSASKRYIEEVLYRVSESVCRCLITLGEEVGGQGEHISPKQHRTILIYGNDQIRVSKISYYKGRH